MADRDEQGQFTKGSKAASEAGKKGEANQPIEAKKKGAENQPVEAKRKGGEHSSPN